MDEQIAYVIMCWEEDYGEDPEPIAVFLDRVNAESYAAQLRQRRPMSKYLVYPTPLVL